MKGQRIAVFGLGRSGLAVARAALANDAKPFVFDETPEDKLSKPEVLKQAIRDGIPTRLDWKGSFADGDFDLIVVNPAIPRFHPKLREAADAGLNIVGEIEFAARISKAPIIAITGTNGKSTTTVMTMLCLQACGELPVLCGNIFGSGYPEIPLTEAAMNSTFEQTLVAEVSSFQLEWTRNFAPAVAGITNITPDHLNRYDSFEDYAATKQKIFAGQTRDDFAVMRANDPVVLPPGSPAGSGLGGNRYRPRHLRGELTESEREGPTVLTFGATGEHAQVDERSLNVLNRHIDLDDLPFREPHNATNAAMACLLAYGALAYRAKNSPGSNADRLLREAESQVRTQRDRRRTVYSGRAQTTDEQRVLPQVMFDGLKAFRGLEHRMEILGTRSGVRVINNSMCTNPDAVIKSAQAIRDPVHLIIGGVNKDLDFKPLANYLANRRNRAYLFGSDRDSIDEMLGGGYPSFVRMEDAFRAATGAAREGEVIMLAPGCASSDQFGDFRDRGNVFKAIAKEWLNS